MYCFFMVLLSGLCGCFLFIVHGASFSALCGFFFLYFYGARFFISCFLFVILWRVSFRVVLVLSLSFFFILRRMGKNKALRSSPHFHVFPYASCVDLTQLLSQPNASWRILRVLVRLFFVFCFQCLMSYITTTSRRTAVSVYLVLCALHGSDRSYPH